MRYNDGKDASCRPRARLPHLKGLQYSFYSPPSPSLFSVLSVHPRDDLIMQLPLALLFATATVAFAMPDNEPPEGLNLHQGTIWRWPSSLRNLLITRPNAQCHESTQQSSFRSRIMPRRRRNHP
ncbi:hypothetical protein BYT27DRAFT_7261479 [Phlegmacium glaucopus]|nr:hypothetical protein BYT27DRAFT_7261479 [Phlegmacium glaucopus]